MTHRWRIGGAFVLASLCLFLLTPEVLASPNEQTGTAPAAFLSIPIGARVTVVPDIVAGMRPDATMLFSNPSNLGPLENSEVLFTTSNWLDGLNMSAAGTAIPVDALGLTWGLGARLLYAGDLNGYDDAGQLVAEEQYYDMAVTTGVGKRFKRIGLSFGAGVTYIREHLAVEDADGVSYTFGAAYTLRRHRLEFAAQDVGGRLDFSDRSYRLDSRYIIGYGYHLDRSWGAFELGTQATLSRGELTRVEAGVSYLANRYLTLRSGFGHATETTAEADLPFSGGLSVHVGTVTLDYAFTPRQYFSDTHTVGLRYRFGGGGPSPIPVPRGHMAPVFSSSPASQSPATSMGWAPTAEQTGSQYLIVGGAHARPEDAAAEARALRQLKIPALVQQVGTRHWVVIDHFDSREAAAKSLSAFQNDGHKFSIIAVNG